MASREFAEIEIIATIAERLDVAVGIIDVKSYYIETPEEVARPRAPLPALRAGGAAVVRAGLRAEPDGALGGAAEAREHGRWRRDRARRSSGVVIEPALTDDAFLADVEARDLPVTLRLWWLGQSGFLVQLDGRHLLLDPYLSDSLTEKYAGTPTSRTCG